ncbi:hypothetical protein ACFL6X_04935 [Candidatus Latescibacterota bacterium]
MRASTVRSSQGVSFGVRALVIAGATLAFLWPDGVAAHRVNVFAAVDGDTIRAEVYYNDGSPCRGAELIVLDAETREVTKGETDTEGRYAFAVPEVAPLTLVVEASLGHRAEFELSAADLSLPAPGVTTRGRANSGEQQVLAADGGQAPATPSVQGRLASLERAVRRLEKAHEAAGLRDAIGGIGYILGLAGLWALLASRRK